MIFLRTDWPNFVYKVTFIVRADLPECCSIPSLRSRPLIAARGSGERRMLLSITQVLCCWQNVFWNVHSIFLFCRRTAFSKTVT